MNTWVQIDADGTQIYLDVDEDVRVLVRTVSPAPANSSAEKLERS